jgi:ribosome biogenesis protein BMS1
VRVAPKCDREVVLYGYLRGANMKEGARVHIAGVGDFNVEVRGVTGTERCQSSKCGVQRGVRVGVCLDKGGTCALPGVA